MKIIDTSDDSTSLSQLLAEAEAGEEVVVARSGTPVARLVPIRTKAVPQPGAWRTAPGWAGYRFDPSVFASLDTDAELAAEGWPA